MAWWGGGRWRWRWRCFCCCWWWFAEPPTEFWDFACFSFMLTLRVGPVCCLLEGSTWFEMMDINHFVGRPHYLATIATSLWGCKSACPHLGDRFRSGRRGRDQKAVPLGRGDGLACVCEPGVLSSLLVTPTFSHLFGIPRLPFFQSISWKSPTIIQSAAFSKLFYRYMWGQAMPSNASPGGSHERRRRLALSIRFAFLCP